MEKSLKCLSSLSLIVYIILHLESSFEKKKDALTYRHTSSFLFWKKQKTKQTNKKTKQIKKQKTNKQKTKQKQKKNPLIMYSADRLRISHFSLLIYLQEA